VTDRALQHRVKTWNKDIPPGSEVEHRSYPSAPMRKFKTETYAYLMGGHTPVVKLEGRGEVLLSTCRRVKATSG